MHIKTQSFYALYQDPITSTLHTTGNADLDEYLGGGFPIGKPIQICGPSGVGKSQLGMQLAASMWNQLNVRGCYFISSSKSSFISTRYLEIWKEFNVLNIDIPEEVLLSNVFVSKVPSLSLLLTQLTQLSSSSDEVGLVCIEGEFDYYQQSHDEYFEFSHKLGKALLNLATSKKCMVIFFNQVRDSFKLTSEISAIPAFALDSLIKSTAVVSSTVPAFGTYFYMQQIFRMSMDFYDEEAIIRVRRLKLDRWFGPYKEPLLFTIKKNGVTPFKES